MKAMTLNKFSDLRVEKHPLQLTDIPVPEPKEGEILVKIKACGVCHTELDEIEGRTPPPSFPVVPGHQAVGHIVEINGSGSGLSIGDRVGIAWIFSSCRSCRFCRGGLENLCSEFKATGRDVNGGYAEFMTVGFDFAHPIPEVFSDIEAAPLLCAGAIGYRSLRLCQLNDGETLGLATVANFTRKKSGLRQDRISIRNHVLFRNLLA